NGDDLERVEVLSGEDNGSPVGPGSGNQGRTIDFEDILTQSFSADILGKSSAASAQQTEPESSSSTQTTAAAQLSPSVTHSFEHASGIPEMMRCGDDDIAYHVPGSVKQKIRSHQFVNLAVLLKGGVELAELYGSNLLSVNEKGQLETRPKTVSEKISNISRWTDAFLIFSSIYLEQFPEKTHELLKYMSVIREAANRHAGFGWRNYDEQFRLRQAAQVQSWGTINSDLWLRCFSSNQPNQASSSYSNPYSSAGSKPPPCLDFNKGVCQWTFCRYTHACSVCSSAQHGRWACPGVASTSGSQARETQGQLPPHAFRGSFRGYRGGLPNSRRFMRGANRGTFRGFVRQNNQ
ncbi:MAG: hypothetical protein AB2693_29275, partial [Candidatus Thiodiazotropha sp.]